MKFHVVKRANGLFAPAYDSDFEKSKRVPVGELIEIEHKQKRNYEYHKKFFAMLKFVMDNAPEVVDENSGEVKPMFNSIDQLLTFVKLGVGHYESIFSGKNEYKIPKSISFAAMDEHEFNDMYNRSFDVVKRIVSVTSEELEMELINYY